MIDKILKGDCLDVMDKIEEGTIDLIYLDPPFFTEKVHRLKNREGTKEFSFDDIWGSDKGYAEFLVSRVTKMKALLSDTGSIFFHCDKSGEHIVRAILDNVFGPENFQSEIIWTYKRWSNSKKGLLPNHQNIYFYSKSKDFKFNKIYKSYSESTNIDQILQKRARNKDNKSIYATDAEGNIEYGGEKKGVPLSDVWDIPYLNPKAKERTGYPTQKPLLLLEQIVELVTEPGDIVLDPFCGSGTTCVAAKMLGRHYIGIDKSEDAIQLTLERLEKPIKTESALLTKGRDSYAQADKAALALLEGVDYNPIHRNKGIDAILIQQYQNSPVLVRVQKKGESLDESYKCLKKAMLTKKSKKAFLIQTAPDISSMFGGDYCIDDSIVLIKSPSVEISERF